MNVSNHKNLPFIGTSHGTHFYFRTVAKFRETLKTKEVRTYGVDTIYIFAILNLAISSKYYPLLRGHRGLYFYFYSNAKQSFIGLHVSLVENVFNVVNIHFIDDENLDFLEDNTFIIKIPESLDVDKIAVLKAKKNRNKRTGYKEISSSVKDISFGFAHTSHIEQSRRSRGKSRLSYPDRVIRSIFNHFIDNHFSYISPYLQGRRREQKLVISFPNRGKTTNVGILVAMDFGVPGQVDFILISAIEDADNPGHKYAFQKEQRVHMSDFDLNETFLSYEKKEKEKKLQRKQKIKNGLSSGCGIWKGRTIDECYIKIQVASDKK